MYEDIFERAFRGDSQAQYEIGDKFYNGDHVPQSYERALVWYRKSAAQGNYWGLFNVAKCYEYGHGVAANRDEAIANYRRACAAGLPPEWDTDWARVRLSELAPGVQVSPRASANHGSASAIDVELVKILQINALKGDAEAQYQLGDAYYNGTGIEQSYKDAYTWYCRSAKQNHHWGQFNVGKCYEHGHGVDRNDQHAAYWYMLSAEQGNDCSAEHFERMFQLWRPSQPSIPFIFCDDGTATWSSEDLRCYEDGLRQKYRGVLNGRYGKYGSESKSFLERLFGLS